MTTPSQPEPLDTELDEVLWKIYPCKAPSKCCWALKDKCMCGATTKRFEAKSRLKQIIATEHKKLIPEYIPDLEANLAADAGITMSDEYREGYNQAIDDMEQQLQKENKS